MRAWEKGNSAEIEYTKTFHATGTPVLISSLVLRSRGCGQVDCARLEFKASQKKLIIAEIKSNQWVSSAQQSRLRNASSFLSKIFDCPCAINFAFGQNGIAKKQKPH